jgi:hypothetical protein
VNEDHAKDATSTEDIFLECAERLRISAEAEGDNRIAGIEALSFRDGDQWDDDIANQRKIDKRPALTINHTNTFCARVENTLRQQRPRIKCHPVGGGARIEDAKVVNGLIRHIETLSNASVAYDKAGASAVNIGWGYVRVVGEYVDPKSFDQELLIKPLHNTFTVYDDPSARMPAGEDRGWLIISGTMKRSQYKIKYRGAANCDWHGGDAPGDMSLAWENKEEIRLAEYYRIHEIADTLYQMSDGRTCLKSELPSAETMQASNWTIKIGNDGKPISRPTARIEVQWFRLNGKTVVDERSSAAAKRTGNPANGPLPGRYIPVFRCLGNELDIDGKITRKGMVKDLMDPARMFNYWRTAETERYALAPKAPWVMAEGQADGHPEWDNANQHSYSRLVYKPVTGPDGLSVLPPPQRQPPVQIEAGMAQAAQGAQSDLMSVAGVPQENPEIQSRVISGNKYLQRRQGMQDLTHFQYYDNQTYMIMWIGIYLLDAIPHYYGTERMQRIIGEDGVPEMVKINQQVPSDGQDPQQIAVYNVKNNLQLGRYDVVMDTGPGYQTKREEGTEAVLGLLGTPLGEPITKVGADLIIRNMDFAGADDLADRLVPLNPEGMAKVLEGLPKQAQAIVGSLQANIQQLQQTVQQQAMELKYRAAIEQEKLKSAGTIKAAELEAQHKKIGTEDATKRFDIESRSQTALAVAEIGGASQLLNTNTEAAHDRRAAQDMIDSAQRAVDSKIN